MQEPEIIGIYPLEGDIGGERWKVILVCGVMGVGVAGEADGGGVEMEFEPFCELGVLGDGRSADLGSECNCAAVFV